jgi:peptidoglycan/xylan/chitin deacetylase (PgdA/CDA1 family)
MTFFRNPPFFVALSHDVDRVAKRGQFIYYLLIAARRLDMCAFALQVRSLWALFRGNDPYWNFERIRNLEDDLGVRSTFFFMDERGKPRFTSLQSQVLFRGRYTLDSIDIQREIIDLDSKGWEIGLHGSYHSYCDATLLGREKKKLEEILGKRVVGIRQHYLRMQIPDTWVIQSKLGFRYDATLGFSNRVGFPMDTCIPFYPAHPRTGERLPILQIPLLIMDTPLMASRDPWREAVAIIDRVEAEGGVLTLDWHQRVFNPWEYSAYQDMYVKIIRECQFRGAWVVPLGKVAEWWAHQAHRREGQMVRQNMSANT